MQFTFNCLLLEKYLEIELKIAQTQLLTILIITCDLAEDPVQWAPRHQVLSI